MERWKCQISMDCLDSVLWAVCCLFIFKHPFLFVMHLNVKKWCWLINIYEEILCHPHESNNKSDSSTSSCETQKKIVCTLSSDKTWILSKHIVISKTTSFFHLAKSKHNNIWCNPRIARIIYENELQFVCDAKVYFLHSAQLWNTIHIGFVFLLSTSFFFLLFSPLEIFIFTRKTSIWKTYIYFYHYVVTQNPFG